MTDEEKIEAAARRLCAAASFFNNCDELVARHVDTPKAIKTPSGDVWAVKVPKLVPLWTFWRRDAAVALELEHVINAELREERLKIEEYHRVQAKASQNTGWVAS